jgi:hypothetical protein
MTSRAAARNNFEYTARPNLPAVTPLVLPGAWLLVIGVLNLFCAISVIAGSEIFITTAGWLVGNSRPWGWLMLVVGLVQLAAAPAVWLGKPGAPWVALASTAWHIAAAVMFLQDSAGVATALLALDALVLASLVAALTRTTHA